MDASKKPVLQRLRKHTELWLSRIIIKTMCRVVSLVPKKGSLALGVLLGDICYLTMKRYRVVAIKNLDWVFGAHKSLKDKKKLTRTVFQNFGKCAFEFLRLPYMTPDDLNRAVKLEGRHHLDQALASKKGVLLITAHFGNWELLAAKLVQDGYPLSVIARDADDADTTQVINHIREGRGYRVFSRDRSMLPVVRSLKKNEILGILPDQHDYDGIFVDFFGRPARTPSGPAALALMTGAELLPVFSFRESDDTITVKFLPVIKVTKTGDKEHDIHVLTAQITKVIEEQIRIAPSQWLWIHNRWKSTPPVDLISSQVHSGVNVGS